MGLKDLSIITWRLEFENIKITSKEKSKIRNLTFDGTGREYFSDWKNYPERFDSLIKAISQTDIKNSLRFLSIDNWCIKYRTCRSILNSFGFETIEIFC